MPFFQLYFTIQYFTMDPECNLQDVIRCDLCETLEPLLHCDACDKHVCKDCEETHSSDKSKLHKIVPFKFRGCINACQKHSFKLCERYCEQCNIPVCEKCVCSHDHDGHEFVDVVQKLENQKRVLQSDLTELVECICPMYQVMVSVVSDLKENVKEGFKEVTTAIHLCEKDIHREFTKIFASVHPFCQGIVSITSVQSPDLKENSVELATAFQKHEENFHREVNFFFNALKRESDTTESEWLAALDKKEDEIISTISEIMQIIDDLNLVLNFNEVSLLSGFKSRNLNSKNCLVKC